MKTDAQVQRDVMAELNWSASVNAARIGVEVNEGIVSLAGHVASVAEKMEAVCAAQRVSGVVALTVAVEVTSTRLDGASDIAIARLTKAALQASGNVPKQSVKVMVEDGRITLSGQVDDRDQRDAAEKAIVQLMGASFLINNIEINRKLTSRSVRANITAALKRHTGTGAKKIFIEVCGSVVILTGTVNSWPEHERVALSVWDDPQVQCVVDNIIVDHSA